MLESSIANPQSSLIVGHQKRWTALARAFAKDSVPQTLLISGPPQTGKETLARRYAQLLLCPAAAPDADGLPAPCGHCRVCHQVKIETFPDYRVYRPIVASTDDERKWETAPDVLESSVILTKMVRNLIDESMRRPLSGARRLIVITQAERMTEGAQNALLKTLEEPSRGLTLLLLSENPSQLLPTVRSRCWHLPLGLASDAEITAWLQSQFAEAAPRLLDEAARVAAGRPGKAWREARRLLAQDDEDEESAAPTEHRSRFVETEAVVERIARSQSVGALGLTEAALRLARQWWNEDQAVLKNKSPGVGKKTRRQRIAFGGGAFFRRVGDGLSSALVGESGVWRSRCGYGNVGRRS